MSFIEIIIKYVVYLAIIACFIAVPFIVWKRINDGKNNPLGRGGGYAR